MPRLARTVVPGCAHQIAQRWPKFDYEYAANTNNMANIAYKHHGDSNEIDYSYDNLDTGTKGKVCGAFFLTAFAVDQAQIARTSFTNSRPRCWKLSNMS